MPSYPSCSGVESESWMTTTWDESVTSTIRNATSQPDVIGNHVMSAPDIDDVDLPLEISVMGAILGVLIIACGTVGEYFERELTQNLVSLW